jgi:hypothetical protein
MSTERIKHVVCVVRGRPSNLEAISTAIGLCLEHEAPLTFLMLLEAEFISQVTHTMSSLRTLYQQMKEMSEFSLLILREEAKQLGVTQVDYIIRTGNLRKQLHEFVTQTSADVMVIVRPTPGPGRTAFTNEQFAAFIRELEEIGNLRIIPIEPNLE